MWKGIITSSLSARFSGGSPASGSLRPRDLCLSTFITGRRYYLELDTIERVPVVSRPSNVHPNDVYEPIVNGWGLDWCNIIEDYVGFECLLLSSFSS